MHNQDTFVGLVAIGLGLAACVGAMQPERLVGLSRMAHGLQETAGRRVLVITYGAVGLFLIGVGISLIL